MGNCVVKNKKNVSQVEIDLDYSIKKLKKKHTGRHLIVDDVEDNRDILKRFLEDKGLEIYEASNGAECVDFISRYDKNYIDVIWMDIKMPFMDGGTAASILRERGFENIIIAVTGYISKETLLKSRHQGIQYLIAKPLYRQKVYSLPIFSIY